MKNKQDPVVIPVRSRANVPMSARIGWALLSIGVAAAVVANVLWPRFLIDRLGYQCAPPTDQDPSQVCAGGLSYVIPLVTLATLVVLSGAVSAITFAVARRKATRDLRWFLITAVLSALVVLFALYMTRSLGDPRGGWALTITSVAAGFCLLAAALRSLARWIASATAVFAAILGIATEVGISAPLIVIATVAVVASVVEIAARRFEPTPT